MAPGAATKPADTAFQVLSFTDNNLRSRDYKKRKIHRKTKSGCITCKAKRVKCDESRPTCTRCQRNGRSCAYPDAEGNSPDNWVYPAPGALSSVTIIPFDAPSARSGTPSLHLMQHAQRHWSEIFQMHNSDILMLLFKSDFLVRNTVLALAACHLRHVAPHEVKHRVAEHYQQHLALQYYQKALTVTGTELSQSDANTIVLSATLLNMVAFTLSPDDNEKSIDESIRSSWVFSNDKNRLGWLVMQAAYRALLHAVFNRAVEVLRFLGPMFLGDEEEWMFTNMSRGVESIPANWAEVFQLSNSEIEDCGPDYVSSWILSPSETFRPSLVVLARLRELEPHPANIFKHLQFLAKINPEIRGLMYRRDERALWMFGYWLGLIRKFEAVWWCQNRARRDYEAIRIYLKNIQLENRAGREGQLWKQMLNEYDLLA